MQDKAQDPRPTPSAAADYHAIDYRLLGLVCFHSVMSQVIYSMLRVTISYRVVEIGLSREWVGYIAGSSAILPMLLAVQVGRYVDRGNDIIALKAGAYLMAFACIGYRFSPSLSTELLIFTVVLGLGHLLLMVSHQVLCVGSAANDASRETALGHYMVAAAIGQGSGPLIVAALGGAQTLPPTRLLFATALVLGVASVLLAYSIRKRQASAKKSAAEAGLTSLPQLLRTPGLPTLMIASIVTVTAQDLIMIFMPLLGTERGIDVGHIGTLLMLRSFAAVVSRLFYPAMIRAIGRVPLTVTSMCVASGSLVVVAMPVPLPVLYVAMILAGFGLGIAATLSISNMIDIAPANARAVALSLRISGNRIGQVSFPVLAGLVAAATGAAGIFGILALGLVSSAVSVKMVRGADKPPHA